MLRGPVTAHPYSGYEADSSASIFPKTFPSMSRK